MKQSEFISKSRINAKLVRAVSRQVGGWKELCLIAQDVARNGANVGWSGFIYCTDTVQFFHRNRAALVQQLQDNADGFGYESAMHYVWHFNGLNTSYGEIAFALYAGKLRQLFDAVEVPNAIAWWILGEICEEIDNGF